MTNVIIRVMTINDYNEVYKIWSNTAGMGMRSLDDSYEGIERFINRNPHTSFVAIVDNIIIAVIFCGHDGRRGFIYHTAVNIAHRGKGIGKALVNRACDELRLEGINKVSLVVFKENDIGNTFWNSIGFESRSDLNYYNISLNSDNM